MKIAFLLCNICVFLHFYDALSGFFYNFAIIIATLLWKDYMNFFIRR